MVERYGREGAKFLPENALLMLPPWAVLQGAVGPAGGIPGSGVSVTPLSPYCNVHVVLLVLGLVYVPGVPLVSVA